MLLIVTRSGSADRPAYIVLGSLADIEFVQVRHEKMAGLMASGETRFTDNVEVCIATSGPWSLHLNGLHDARLDHRPLVALVGQQARSAMCSHYQQDLDLQSLFKDVAGEFVLDMVTDPNVPPLPPHINFAQARGSNRFEGQRPYRVEGQPPKACPGEPG